MWFTLDLQVAEIVKRKHCSLMKKYRILFYFIAFFVFLRSPLRAEPVLPHLFSDHMVIQRETEIRIWGWADAGEKISVSLGAGSGQAITNADGRWRVTLPAMRAGGPFTLLVQDKKTIVFRDVMRGEVWVASGQSNMAYALSGATGGEKEISHATYPGIRFFTVPKKIAVEPQSDTLPAAWEVCSPEIAKSFSAVSYFFASDLHKVLGVPVGIILSAWPGTAGEEWTDSDSLRREPALKPIVERWDASASYVKSYAAHPAEFSIEFDDFELICVGNDPQGPLSLSNFDDGAAQIATGGNWTYDWQGAPDSVFELVTPGRGGRGFAARARGALDGTSSSRIKAGFNADNGPVDHFSVRWTGYFVPRTDDDYKFYVSADDGVRLFINDERVIDDWQRHGETLDTYSMHMEPGKLYKIRLEYFENVGTATARFGIAAATQALGAETKALASKADAVVLCVGFDPSIESEGGDRTFRLPGGQDALIQQILEVNKNVIVVLTAGGNVDMTPWIDQVPALLHTWYPGQEGGTAFAQILFGEVSPSGKLPASFERRWEDNASFGSYYPKKGDKRVEYKEGIFVGYRHFDRAQVKPLFPFGYGLSYTTFQYSDLKVTPLSADLSAPVTVSCNVKNTGSREGAEVVEVYVGDSHASVPRPVKELKGFAKVHLRPGETKRVTVSLERRAFSFYDVEKNNWKAEPGKFSILVGSSSEKIELQGEFTLSQ